jgi:hypothetical protein
MQGWSVFWHLPGNRGVADGWREHSDRQREAKAWIDDALLAAMESDFEYCEDEGEGNEDM